MSIDLMQKTRVVDTGSRINPAPMTLADPRADGQSRTVRLSTERVTIDRSYCGVAMRLSIPIEAYQGVCVGLRPAQTGGVSYELRLVHRDAELSVSLSEAADDRNIWADWRAWGRFFGLPTLIERNEGLVEWGHAPGKVAPPAVKAPVALKRRVKRRRAAFVTKRHSYRGTMGTVYHEAEMIARD